MAARNYIFWILFVGLLVAVFSISLFLFSISIYKSRGEKIIAKSYDDDAFSLLFSSFLDISFLSLDCKKAKSKHNPYVKNKTLLNGFVRSIFLNKKSYNIVGLFIYNKGSFLLYRSRKNIKNRKKVFLALKEKFANINIKTDKISFLDNLMIKLGKMDKCGNKMVVGFIYIPVSIKSKILSLEKVFSDAWIFVIAYVLLSFFTSFVMYMIIRNAILNMLVSDVKDYEKFIADSIVSNNNKNKDNNSDIPDAISIK